MPVVALRYEVAAPKVMPPVMVPVLPVLVVIVPPFRLIALSTVYVAVSKVPLLPIEIVLVPKGLLVIEPTDPDAARPAVKVPLVIEVPPV